MYEMFSYTLVDEMEGLLVATQLRRVCRKPHGSKEARIHIKHFGLKQVLNLDTLSYYHGNYFQLISLLLILHLSTNLGHL